MDTLVDHLIPRKVKAIDIHKGVKVSKTNNR